MTALKAQTYTILSIVLIIIISIFAVLNVGAVEVNYFFWKGRSPLILVILFSVLMGGLITTGSGLVKFVKLRKENKALRLENERMNDLLAQNGLEQPLLTEAEYEEQE